MKFGRNLPRNQVPEWASSYINYKGLKKLIKNATEEVQSRQMDVADTAGFFFALDRNLEDVDTFYNKKFSDATRRLKLLQDQYGKSLGSSMGLDKDELEELVGALLELRSSLRKLQWYGEVNRRGFVKITKKLDKKIPDHGQWRYVESKVDLKLFATNRGLIELITTTNELLSRVGDIKPAEDSRSLDSEKQIPQGTSKAALSLPQAVLDMVDQAIRSDDAPILAEVLQGANLDHYGTEDHSSQRFLLGLLQRSITSRSRYCIGKLLGLVDYLDDKDDINQRNCLHRFIISLSRTKKAEERDKADDPMLDASSPNGNYITPAAPPMLASPVKSTKKTDNLTELGEGDKAVKLLSYILDSMSTGQRTALRARDISGRTPLHYAAKYGFVVICQIIIARMQTWGQFESSDGTDALFCRDSEGWAPLDLSVIGGHPLTTKALLEAEEWRGQQDRKAIVRRHMSKSGEVLALATKSNFVDIIKLLVEAGVDVNHQDEQGESALHVAARYGHGECAKVLINGTDDQKSNIELVEKTFGWTPLFIACVDGHLNIVELLIEAGADMDKADFSGWTPKEHATLRGHITIARTLAEHAGILHGQSSQLSPSSISTPSGLTDRRSSNIVTNGHIPLKTTEPVKAFGHRYLTDKTMVLVSLGTMDMRKNIPAVELDRIPLAEAHLTQLDTALSVVVSASGAEGEPEIVDLPIQENISTEPMIFTTLDATKVKLLFDIVPTYAGSKDRIVGRGVALLSSIKPSIGSKRITLQGDVTVPIIAAHNLEVIGCVNFNFLIVTPFKHPNMSITEKQTYWKSMTSTMVIGHRGLGKNQASRTSLQLGENTIQSFISAANLGASYVEFDVQLTKDHVPVIYHDFLVSETGIDAPVHTLTLEQFLHVNDGRTPRSSRPPSPTQAIDAKVKGLQNLDSRRQRSMSVDVSKSNDVADMSERMKHTRDFKAKGFKANSRGNFIQAPFTTLEEMFKKLPEHIGFNIEMKYPMLHESEEHEMDTYAVELNSFVDTVLTKVYDLGKKRNVIFSSFNPDICLLLSFKQPSIPILFLTEAGTCSVGDIRASSLQEAIRFASRWNLLGIVSAAEPLVLSPRLVRVVKESGLVCVSYGTLNNNPQYVQPQVQEGIDAVIVDSVLAIRKGLTGSGNKIPPDNRAEHSEANEPILVNASRGSGPVIVTS